MCKLKSLPPLPQKYRILTALSAFLSQSTSIRSEGPALCRVLGKSGCDGIGMSKDYMNFSLARALTGFLEVEG